MAVAKKTTKKSASLKHPRQSRVKKISSVSKNALSAIKKRLKLGTKKTVIKKTVTKKTDLKGTKPTELFSSSIKPELSRYHGNPIIEPNEEVHWESKATFNPTAIVHDDTVHLVYRAIGDADISRLGYATSSDGFTFQKTPPHLIYAHSSSKPHLRTEPKIDYSSGGSWSGGCEDPRLVLIDDVVYLTYTAFDGWSSIRIAFTSIPLKDFIDKNWNWKDPVFISAEGEIHKNWVLFPEKIKGKYAILHCISPHIMIEYVNDLSQFDGSTFFIDSIHRDNPSWELRDKEMRGAGPAPIRTKYGWLLFYHGTERTDPDKYKLSAMLLDIKQKSPFLNQKNSTKTSDSSLESFIHVAQS